MKKYLLLLFTATLFLGTVGKAIAQGNTIGKPVKFGKLLIAQYDIGELNWADAKKACAKLGTGWRLPTKDELNVLYENKDSIGEFYPIKYPGVIFYWSATLSTSRGDAQSNAKNAWFQDFADGSQKDFDSYWSSNKVVKYYVRAVRSF